MIETYPLKEILTRFDRLSAVSLCLYLPITDVRNEKLLKSKRIIQCSKYKQSFQSSWYYCDQFWRTKMRFPITYLRSIELGSVHFKSQSYVKVNYKDCSLVTSQSKQESYKLWNIFKCNFSGLVRYMNYQPKSYHE